MIAPWLVAVIVAVALSVISYAITPKPKAQKPEAVKDLEAPTSEAGRPIPVIFGEITVKGLNVLHTSDKSVVEYEVRA